MCGVEKPPLMEIIGEMKNQLFEEKKKASLFGLVLYGKIAGKASA